MPPEFQGVVLCVQARQTSRKRDKKIKDFLGAFTCYEILVSIQTVFNDKT